MIHKSATTLSAGRFVPAAQAKRGDRNCAPSLKEAGLVLEEAQRALQRAETDGNVKEQLRLRCYCALICFHLGRPKQMQGYLEEASRMPELAQSPAAGCLFHAMMGLDALARNEKQTASQHLNKAVAIGAANPDCVAGHAQALNGLADLHRQAGDYSIALRCLQQLQQLIQQHEEAQTAEASYCSNIGALYRDIGDVDRSIDCYERARRLYRQKGNQCGTAETLLELGRLSLTRGRHDCALDLLHQALTLFEDLQRGADGITTRAFISLTLQAMGRTDEALAYIREPLERQTGTQDRRPPFALLHFAAGCAMRAMGRPEEARILLEKARDAALLTKDRQLAMRIYEHMAEVAEARNDVRSALGYHRQGEALREELLGAERQRDIARLELQELQADSEEETQFLRRNRDIARRQVQERQAEIDKLNVKISAHNAALQRLHTQVQAHRELARGGSRGFVDELLTTISAALDQPAEGARFDAGLQSVFADFLTALRGRCPHLSPAEMRICLLLRLEMDSKEIAALLHNSLETIHTHRRHIRRKLGLAQQVNLSVELGKLSA